MTQLWFVPLALVIGIAGTRTALHARHTLKVHRKDRSWWLPMVLGWFPLACWILSQFVAQD